MHSHYRKRGEWSATGEQQVMAPSKSSNNAVSSPSSVGSTPDWYPILRYPFSVTEGTIEIGDTIELVADPTTIDTLARTLDRLDGTTSFNTIVKTGGDSSEDISRELLATLDKSGLVDDAGAVECRSGSEVILELEEQMEDLCDATIFQNPFWKTCLNAKVAGDLSQQLATGMVIENWHFLFRESYFDAPVLSYVPNTEVRLILNQFFSEEYGHDEILLKSLEHQGLTRTDMADAIPLPQTMGLCNALAYWAHNDPLFFFVTLGLLEGQGMKEDSFIEACTRVGLPEPFIAPLRTHANININAEHGNLTRLIFQKLERLHEGTIQRLKSQLPLFVRLYDNFYAGIWEYYGEGPGTLRRVSEL